MLKFLASRIQSMHARKIMLLISGACIFFLLAGVIELNLPRGDITLYQCMGKAFLHISNAHTSLGQLCPYIAHQFYAADFRHLPQYYPFFAILLFAYPLLFSYLDYQLVFGITMAVCVGLVLWILYRQRGVKSLVSCVLYFMLGSMTLLVSRFDIVPSLLVLLSIVFSSKKKYVFAYLLLSCAILFKIYPLPLLFGLFIFQTQQTDKQSVLTRFAPPAVACIIFLTCYMVVTVIDPHYLANFISFFSQRGIEIESLPATILVISGLFFHIPMCVMSQNSNLILGEYIHTSCISSFSSSFNSVVSSLSIISIILYGFGVTWTFLLQKKKIFSLIEAFISIILLTLATTKLLSPQYIIWLSPLIAYRYRTHSLWILIWGMICICTSIEYPIIFTHLFHYSPYPLLFLVTGIRNILLVLLWLAFMLNWQHIRTTGNKETASSLRT